MRRTITTAVAASTLLALAALGSGCDRGDSLDQRVAEASNELRAIARALPVSDVRQRRYSQVVSDLSSALSAAGDDPSAPAANAVLAEATLGQGVIEEVRARDLAEELSEGVIAGRSELDLAQRRLSLVRAMGSFDPEPELEQYRSSIEERAEEIRTHDAMIAELTDAIARLEAAAEREAQEADEARTRESEVRLEAADAGPIRRAELIELATRERRDAERHERRQAELELEVTQLTETREAVERDRDQARDRKGLAEQASDRTRSVDRFMSSQARELEDAALAGLADIRDQMDSLIELATGDLEQAIGASSSRFRSALNYARSSDRETQAVLTGSIQARSARLAEAAADAMERLALLLDRAALLPDGSGYAQASGDLRDRIDELREEAASSFESAASSYGRGGSATRDVADELDGVVRRLEAHAARLRGEPEAPEGGVEPDDAGEG